MLRAVMSCAPNLLDRKSIGRTPTFCARMYTVFRNGVLASVLYYSEKTDRKTFAQRRLHFMPFR